MLVSVGEPLEFAAEAVLDHEHVRRLRELLGQAPVLLAHAHREHDDERAVEGPRRGGVSVVDGALEVVGVQVEVLRRTPRVVSNPDFR